MLTRLTMQKCEPCWPYKLFRPCKPYFMLEQLFGSKARYRILRTLFRESDKPFFVRELARAIDAQINAVRREIELLLNLGLLKEEIEKKPKSSSAEYGASLRKYYRLDKDSALFAPLSNLLDQIQVIGEDALVRDLKAHGGKIKLLLLTGCFTKDYRAPSDLLIVGALKERSIAKLISDYEKELGSVLRYTTMSEPEFKERRHMMDKFLFALFEAENVRVVNELGV